MLMSVATLVGFVWIMYQFAVEPASPEPAAETSAGRGAAPKRERRTGSRR